MFDDTVLRLACGCGGFAAATATWALSRPAARPAHVRHRAGRPKWLGLGAVCAAAVAAACLPPLGWTGAEGLDRLWQALLVLIASASGSVAAPGITAVSFATLAAGASGPGIGSASALATGIVVAAVASSMRWPRWLGGLAGAGIAGLVLAGGRNAGLGDASVQTVALAVLALGAVVRRRPVRRRAALAVVGGGALLVAVGLALTGVAVVRARPRLERAGRDAATALSAARSGRSDEVTKALSKLEHDLRAARSDLRSPITWAGWVLPISGANLRAVDHAISAAVIVQRSGVSVAAVADARTLRVKSGRVPIDAIAALDAPVLGAQTQLTSSYSALARIHTDWLVAPVQHRLTAFRDQVLEAQRATGVALELERLAIAMLGGAGRRTYFVAFTTPDELRGTTGLSGNYGEVVATDGRLRLDRFGRIEELARAAPKSADSLGLDPQFSEPYQSALQGSLWSNITIYPDFPVVADAIEKLYPKSSGEPVDGVISLDPDALAALLSVEGPVSVPMWPEPLTSANLPRVLNHDQYDQWADADMRSKFLSELTGAVLDRLTTIDAGDIGSLVRTLHGAVQGKHLLLASTRPAEEGALRQIGLSGQVAPFDDDSLAVYDVNASGNKIDYFLHRSITYDVTPASSPGILRALLTVTLRNDAPPSGEARFLIGNVVPGGLSSGVNRDNFSVLTPWQVVTATVDGTTATMAQVGILGRNLFSVQVDIPPGATRVIKVGLIGHRSRTGYTLDFTAQPMANTDHLDVRVDGPEVVATSLSTAIDGDLSVRAAPS